MSQAQHVGMEALLVERETRLAECTGELARANVTMESQRTALSAAAGRKGELREENARMAGRCEQLVLALERNLAQLAEREARERQALHELVQIRAELAAPARTTAKPTRQIKGSS